MTSTPTKAPVTTKNALFSFYDIESLSNVFTVAVLNPRGDVHMFYRIDTDDALRAQMLAAGGIDERAAAELIRQKNPAWTRGFDGKVFFHDLSTFEANEYMATIFGLSDADSVNDPDAFSSYGPAYRIVCDTDPGYDPVGKHDYLVGYNSYNYDSSILAIWLEAAFAHLVPERDADGNPVATASPRQFMPPTAAYVRQHNDGMFEAAYRKYMPKYLTDGPVAGGKGWGSQSNKIRKAMMDTGRHVDAARLNEKQQKVALKRLCGMMGLQILESDKLSGHNARITSLEELHELMAYNVSDVVNLRELFFHKTYAGSFDLRKGLLDEYPETVYDAKTVRRTDPDTGEVVMARVPDQRPSRVRRGRLTPDSSSAKFVGVVLSPYGNLSDLETVSYVYPSERVSRETGIPQVNVLTEARKFFYENIADPGARARFDKVYEYYRSIEGRNFNDSPEYREEYPGMETSVLPEIPKSANNVPYFRADGTPSSCFATFSYGGIHGAEANTGLHAHDVAQANAEYHRVTRLVEMVSEEFPDATQMRQLCGRQEVLDEAGDVVLNDKGKPVLTKDLVVLDEDGQEITDKNGKPVRRSTDYIRLSDGTFVAHRDVLVPGSTIKKGCAYKQPEAKDIPLFKAKDDGSDKLQPKYVFTSVARVNHEDFTSYYPNMLRNMSAFYNPELGGDRYAEIFFQKEELGKLMKDKSLPAEEREAHKVGREGTKLILNTASGAGDATHKTPIRMNNRIISMRIIGQLFSWRIGQAQTLAGGRIVSTNTDGLYSADLDDETNNRVLAEQAAQINVEIKPEPMLLVSKDSNNRLEIVRTGDQPWQTEVVSASGASLGCYRGPHPSSSLNHPAVVDYVLVEYLRALAGGYQPPWADAPLSIDAPFDEQMGKAIIKDALAKWDPFHATRMFQNVIAASAGSITYPFATDPVAEDDVVADGDGGGGAVTDAQAAAKTETAVDDEDMTQLDRALSELNPRALQHYNRVFVVRRGTAGAVNLRNAGAWAVTAAMLNARKRNQEAPRQVSSVAKAILEANGLSVRADEARRNGTELLPTDQDIAVRKISGIEADWPMLVVNQDLHHLDEGGLESILGSLDLDVYLQMAKDSYEKNWMNVLPQD